MTLLDFFAEQALSARRWEAEFQHAVEQYTSAQVRWLLARYRDETPYPNPRDFVTYLVAAQDVPDDLLARAALQGGRAAARIMQEIMELEAAWFPTVATETRLGDLRGRLEAALR